MCAFLFFVFEVDWWSFHWLRCGIVLVCVWSVCLVLGGWVVITRVYPRSLVPGAYTEFLRYGCFFTSSSASFL